MPNRTRARWISLFIGLFLIGASTACSPSLAPLYRDYEVDDAFVTEREDVYPRIRQALEDDGWQLAESSAPNSVATEERRFSHWGIYQVVASLEVVPFGDGHVRLFIHPYRDFITGGRSKIPYLTPSLRRKLVSGLNETFETHGLQVREPLIEREG